MGRSLRDGQEMPRRGTDHPQGWTCDGQKEAQGADHYLPVGCAPLTGLEQHLISQAVGGRSGIKTSSCKGLTPPAL